MPSSRYYRFKAISKEERAKKREIAIFWGFFTAGLLTILWAFFLSPFFKITEIKLPQNTIITNDYIRQLIANNKPFDLGQNLLVLGENNLKANLAAVFPEITDIMIKKELFHTLNINFQKRMPVGIWCNNNCYYFDKEGIVFKEAPVSEGSLILKINDSNKMSVSLGDQVLNPEQLNFIMEFNEKIGGGNLFRIVEFKIKPTSDLEALTSGGWSIYLDQSQNPSIAAGNLITILNEAVKNKISNLEYIDLRISTRVFYKFK